MLQDALRQAIENIIAHVDPVEYPEVVDVRVSLSNMEEEVIYSIHLTVEDDGSYLFDLVKKEIEPYLPFEEVDLILEDDLTQHLEENL